MNSSSGTFPKGSSILRLSSQNKDTETKAQNKRLSYFDAFVIFGVCTVGTLSIFRQFSSYGNLDQFGQPVNFSMGAGHSNAEYFFQVTLWNLWIAVVGYIVIYDIIINRLLRGKKEITPAQGIINRMLATLALGVAFVYWAGMGIPRALSGNSNTFYLVNTFCLHFIIPLIALLYYYVRHKKVEYSEEKTATKNKVLTKLAQGNLWYWLGCFFICATLFTGLSFVLQYAVSTNYTPVYDVIDWHGGFMSIAMGVAACVAMPLLFTAILYIMHVEKPSNKKYLRPAVLGFIVFAMSFTLTYGILHNATGWNLGPSIAKIDVGVALIGFGVAALLSFISIKFGYKKLSESDALQYTFPQFFKTGPTVVVDDDNENEQLLVASSSQ